MSTLRWVAAALTLAGSGGSGGLPPAAAVRTSSCFILYEVGVGEVRRSPSASCGERVTPASTFKIAHALAALDAGIVTGPDEAMTYDGSPQPFAAWRRDQTLATAMRYSVVWYFKRVAGLLGMELERRYLVTLDYGNRDPTSGLTSFWLGGSLRISPDEQAQFLMRLFRDDLPIGHRAMTVVRDILIQPPGVVTNAAGAVPFARPWPRGTTLGAKTGSATNADGRGVRWLVGHVARDGRQWVFVSEVTGPRDLSQTAAIELAARVLRREKVL